VSPTLFSISIPDAIQFHQRDLALIIAPGIRAPALPAPKKIAGQLLTAECIFIYDMATTK
jgi:hypothetical protein